MDPSTKREDVAEIVAARVEAGRWRLSGHAESNMQKREVIQPEVRKVLTSGRRHSDYDEWKPEYESWNYALQDETVDRRTLRVIVAFAPNDDVVVVTVIAPQLRGS